MKTPSLTGCSVVMILLFGCDMDKQKKKISNTAIMAASTISGMFGQASTELALLPNLNSSHSGYIWHLLTIFLSELMLVRKKQHKKLKLCGETFF